MNQNWDNALKSKLSLNAFLVSDRFQMEPNLCLFHPISSRHLQRCCSSTRFYCSLNQAPFLHIQCRDSAFIVGIQTPLLCFYTSAEESNFLVLFSFFLSFATSHTRTLIFPPQKHTRKPAAQLAIFFIDKSRTIRNESMHLHLHHLIRWHIAEQQIFYMALPLQAWDGL